MLQIVSVSMRLSKVFIVTFQHLAWNVDTFVKFRHPLVEEDQSMKKIEQRTSYGAVDKPKLEQHFHKSDIITFVV